MHVQNKAFGNIGFQSTWVFGSHELEEYRMEKRGQIKVKPHGNEKK